MIECKELGRGELLERLIVALCADYERRKSVIAEGRMGRRVRMEYEYVNARVFDGAGEISGGALAELFINEIGSGTGYASSKVPAMTEETYKAYKMRIKHNIARKLCLID